MLNLRLTRTAENDLDNIWFYTLTEWGEEQANKYVTLIEKGFYRILENTCIGKERTDVKKGYLAIKQPLAKTFPACIIQPTLKFSPQPCPHPSPASASSASSAIPA